MSATENGKDMTKQEAKQIGDVIRINRFHFKSAGVRKLADLFVEIVPEFNRDLWYAQIDKLRDNQPVTGKKCHCRPGIERDNCPLCEATGWVIDFAAIRARRAS